MRFSSCDYRQLAELGCLRKTLPFWWKKFTWDYNFSLVDSTSFGIFGRRYKRFHERFLWGPLKGTMWKWTRTIEYLRESAGERTGNVLSWGESWIFRGGCRQWARGIIVQSRDVSFSEACLQRLDIAKFLKLLRLTLRFHRIEFRAKASRALKSMNIRGMGDRWWSSASDRKQTGVTASMLFIGIGQKSYLVRILCELSKIGIYVRFAQHTRSSNYNTFNRNRVLFGSIR